MHRTYYFQGRVYTAVPPQPDTPEISAACERLMLLHGGLPDDETRLFIAPIGEMRSGWVIGVFQ